MTTKILGNQITNYTIDTVQLSNTATAAFAKTLAPKVLYANVASNTFTVLDDTAVNVGGGYIVVTGAEFQSGATVLIDTTPASAVTYVNSTTLQVQVPTKSAASYNLYVVNPDGGVGIKVSGVTYSSEPAWVTTSPLANQNANTAFGVNLSATSASSYSVAAGSTLPAGTTLAANGYFSGTVTIGAQTTYTFSVVATDAELQDSTKTFQVTVTVTPSGKIYAWGFNATYALGLNDTNSRSSPTQVGSATNWTVISAARHFSFGIQSDGTLWSWGQDNNFGQLAQNDGGSYKNVPTKVGNSTNWNLVTGGWYHAAAIKTDGTLWTWGRNHQEQLGLNDTVPRSSPTQVGTANNWSQVATGKTHTLAIKTDGTLWAWGQNNIGQLGVGNLNSYNSPKQVGTGTDWNLVSANHNSSTAIKSNGTLWSWGQNSNGELGINSTSNNPNSPTQVGTGTNWSKIYRGLYHMMAVKTDGSLWLCGYNGYGELGQTNVIDRSSPVQVAGTTWNLVSGGKYTSIATKTDGTLWSWGANGNFGKLGLNDTPVRSSPTQIGTATNWNKISMYIDHVLVSTIE
jgi:alpha-tubulin suppressor-like RCC1 family protein